MMYIMHIAQPKTPRQHGLSDEFDENKLTLDQSIDNKNCLIDQGEVAVPFLDELLVLLSFHQI